MVLKLGSDTLSLANSFIYGPHACYNCHYPLEAVFRESGGGGHVVVHLASARWL